MTAARTPANMPTERLLIDLLATVRYMLARTTLPAFPGRDCAVPLEAMERVCNAVDRVDERLKALMERPS